MKKNMTITYEVDGALYLNVTNRCTNNCDFCIRRNGDGAYGSDSLWLEREPTEEEILNSVFSRDLAAYREIVFCGYGEPSFRLKEARAVALLVKEKYPDMKIRINTNGQSDLIHRLDTAPFYKDAFDAVSISLNAPNAEKYARVSQPAFGLASFDAILGFASRVKNYVPSVAFSVVDEALTDEEIEECKKLADSCGVSLRVRKYIGK